MNSLKKFTIVAAALLLCSPFGMPALAQELQEFKAIDGVNLVSYLIKQGGYAMPPIKTPKAVVVILTEENSVWLPYQQLTGKFGACGFFNLIVEMRGQGGSVCKANGTNVFNQKFSNAEWAAVPGDVRLIVEQANGKLWPKNTPVFLLGFSKSANAVGIAAAQCPTVKGVIMVSPSLDYSGLQPLESLKKFTGMIMLAAAAKDNVSGDAITKMAAALPANRVDIQKSVNGDFHGLAILKIEPFLPDRMASFMQKCISKK
jgi:dienelactone hydrolase